MKRSLAALLAVSGLMLASCGGPTPRPAAPPAKACNPPPGRGTIGACVPQAKARLTPPRVSGVRIPDVSSYQGCPNWPQGTPGVIFKVYEGGWHQDPSALCNARRLRAIHAWYGVYTFLRPGNCIAEAAETVRIIRAIGGLTGPVVADAEVPLPPGFVTCFVSTVAYQMHNTAQVIYTSPGTWPGGSLARSLWVATYGSSPGCVAGVCSHVAWQYTDRGCAYGLCGDLSLDTGIRQIVQTRPVDRSALKARRETLRRVLLHYGCRHRKAHQERLGPRCLRWFAEGTKVNQELKGA